MIYTLTPNPCIDRTIKVPEIRFNWVMRSQNLHLDWGGKGFNVSRSLQQFGMESLALAWVGGGTGKMLSDGLQALGIQTDFVWVDKDTRTNTMIIEESSDWHIKVNEPGPSLSKEDIDQLFLKIETYAKKGDVWILSGSLPPGVPEHFYADLIRLIKSRGAWVYLDTSGGALRHGLDAVPYLVKPNLDEASEIVGFRVADKEDAKRAALPFLRMGVTYCALTMGGAGLLLATQRKMVLATPPKVKERNATGSGDSLLAGLIYALSKEMSLVEVARWAVATATASVETEGVSTFDVERVQDLLPEVDSKVVNVM
jgi:1-phosphofructokinase family hexose kinase